MRNCAHNILKAACTAGVRLVPCIVMLALSVFSLRAQDYTRVKVLFPFDRDTVAAGYQNNAASLAVLKDAISTMDADSKLVVTSFSSPEGNLAYNRNLSLRRAKSMQAFLENNYPALAGRIILHPGEEAWDELRRSVSEDSRLPEETRSAALNIIDSNADLDVKEKELTALPAYKRLYANYFKSLRYAAIELRIENSENAEARNAGVGGHSDADGVETVTVNSGLPTVYYAQNEDFIRPSYMGNDASMKEIIRLLRSGSVKDMVIEGTASPDGPANSNNRLANERGENLKNYIVGMFPELEDKITVVSKGENWEGLEGYTKENVREATDALPYLRYARIANIEVEKEIDANEEEVVAEESVIVADTKKDEQPSVTEEIITGSESAPAEDHIKKPIAALTTNLLYTTAGAIATGFHAVPLTIGYEIPIGKHWSIHSNYLVTTPWQAWNDNADCAELMHWDLGARWYPGTRFTKPFTRTDTRVLEGWYASAHVGMGYYDFQRNGNGYQGEEILGSIGLGYGLCFNDHWSLNFGIGVGPMSTRYRYYEGRQNNNHLVYRYSGTFTYFGVTDAKVTLTCLFYYKKHNGK